MLKKISKLNFLLGCIVMVLLIKPSTWISADELDIPIEIDLDSPYVYAMCASCTLSISSGGTVSVRSLVDGYAGTTSISVTVYLEKLVNGSWQSYTSWSHNGGRSIDNTDSTTVTHGAYRVWMYVTAGNAYGSESFNVDGNTCGY